MSCTSCIAVLTDLVRLHIMVANLFALNQSLNLVKATCQWEVLCFYQIDFLNADNNSRFICYFNECNIIWPVCPVLVWHIGT